MYSKYNTISFGRAVCSALLPDRCTLIYCIVSFSPHVDWTPSGREIPHRTLPFCSSVNVSSLSKIQLRPTFTGRQPPVRCLRDRPLFFLHQFHQFHQLTTLFNESPTKYILYVCVSVCLCVSLSLKIINNPHWPKAVTNYQERYIDIYQDRMLLSPRQGAAKTEFALSQTERSQPAR